jgi:predicted GNAT family acetyltransferase
VENGVIASRINSFFDVLTKDGKRYDWAWNANLFTPAAYRGRGLAEKLIENQLSEFAKRGLVWGGTFSSDPALRLYRKLGFNVVGSAPRMCLLRRPQPFLAHHLQNKTARRLLSDCYRLAYRGAGSFLFRQRKFHREFRIGQIDAGELARILRDHPLHYGERTHWRDDPALLRAKMDVRKTDQISIVREASSERPVLFLVWRVRETLERPIKEKYRGVRMCSVMEYGFICDPEPSDALIEAAIALHHEAGADLLEIVSASHTLEQSARRHGFVPLGTGMSFTFKAPPGHPLEKVETSISDWHLTHYSGDGYSFE